MCTVCGCSNGESRVEGKAVDKHGTHEHPGHSHPHAHGNEQHPDHVHHHDGELHYGHGCSRKGACWCSTSFPARAPARPAC